jgi:hypothetical protein
MLTVLRSQARDLQARVGLLERTVDVVAAEDGPSETAVHPSSGFERRPSSAKSARSPKPGLGLGQGIAAGLMALGGTSVFWFASVVVMVIFNGDADKLLINHDWLGLLFEGSLTLAFAALIIALARTFNRAADVSLWAIGLILLTAAVPTFMPLSTGAELGAIGGAGILAGLLLWAGSRRDAVRRFAAPTIVQALAGGAFALVAVPAVALAFYPHPGGGTTGTADRSFCSTHHCIASFEQGRGTIVQCQDGEWSQSGGIQGACSHHDGVRLSSSSDDVVSRDSSGYTPPPPSSASASGGDSGSVAPPEPRRAPGPTRAALAASAKQYVEAYYTAIDLHDWQSAWDRLPASTRSATSDLTKWRSGYANTIRTNLTGVEASMGSDTTATVQLKLHSTDFDACSDSVHQRFAIAWSLARQRGRWTATSISSSKEAGGSPVLSATDCPSTRAPTTPAPQDDPSFCDYAQCIPNFDQGTGTIVMCADGQWSHSGGQSGACSGHRGELTPGLDSARPAAEPADPTSSDPSAPKTVHVQGYTRKDGTYVASYDRRPPCTYC